MSARWNGSKVDTYVVCQEEDAMHIDNYNALSSLRRRALFLVSILVMVFVSANSVVFAASLSGAIFTTTPDGSFVNQNVKYNDKKEV